MAHGRAPSRTINLPLHSRIPLPRRVASMSRATIAIVFAALTELWLLMALENAREVSGSILTRIYLVLAIICALLALAFRLLM